MKLTIKNGQFYPTPPDGVYLLKDWVEARNYEQLKLLWVLYTFVEKESGNDRDFLHEMMKKKFLSTKKMVKLGKSRNFVVKVGSTSNLNKKEMSEFYNLFIINLIYMQFVIYSSNCEPYILDGNYSLYQPESISADANFLEY